MIISSIKTILTSILVLTCFASMQALNAVTIEGGQGVPGERAAIKILLTTDASNAAALEIRVPLPDQTSPVEGSLCLNESSAPGFDVTSDVNGNEYVIVLFNSSLKNLPRGSGELLTFELYLGENPGYFDLTPNVKLSDDKGNSLQVATNGGTLTILAPKMELTTFGVDFGRIPIYSKEIRRIGVRNIGTQPLEISQYTTDVEGLTAVLPESIDVGESATIELHYTPTIRSEAIDGVFTPISDGVGATKFVRIQSSPFSVNELHLTDASGVCDETVTISVTMNNMDPIVGVDFTIQLPEELKFVENSIEKSDRSSAFSVESGIDSDRNLRIILFGTSYEQLKGNNGEILTFKLKLDGTGGMYTISPVKAVLANAAGENMISDIYSGNIHIQAPILSASSEWKMGNVPNHENETLPYLIKNEGEVPLTIENIVFHDDVAECLTELPFTIYPYSEKYITAKITQSYPGSFETTMNIYTNDPNNRMKQVSVTGNVYSPNEMFFIGRCEDNHFYLDASLTNEDDITALQLDFICPEGITTDENLLHKSERAENHSLTLTQVDYNRYRLILFSIENEVFKYNEGNLFSIEFTGESLAGKQIVIEGIKLCSKSGENLTTPDSEVKIGTLSSNAEGIFNEKEIRADIFDINGILVRSNCKLDEIRDLPPSVYLVRYDNKITKIAVGCH